MTTNPDDSPEQEHFLVAPRSPGQGGAEALGRFQAYLGDGRYRVVAGRDRDGNGVYGEAAEASVQRTATMGPDAPAVDLGDLVPVSP